MPIHNIQAPGEVLHVIAQAEATNKSIYINDGGKVSIAKPWRQFFVQVKSLLTGTNYKQISHLAAKEFFISLLQEETQNSGVYGYQDWKTLTEHIPALRWKADSNEKFDTLSVLDQLQSVSSKINYERTRAAGQALQAAQGLNNTRIPGTKFQTEEATTLYYKYYSGSDSGLFDEICNTMGPFLMPEAAAKKARVEFDHALEHHLTQLEKGFLDAPGEILSLPDDLLRGLLKKTIYTSAYESRINKT
jgi:hypothetical protein